MRRAIIAGAVLVGLAVVGVVGAFLYGLYLMSAPVPDVAVARAGDDLVVVYPRCDGEWIQSVTATAYTAAGSPGRILWQVEAREPTSVEQVRTGGEPPPGFRTSVALNERAAESADEIDVEVTTNRTAQGLSFTWRELAALDRDDVLAYEGITTLDHALQGSCPQ